VEFERWTAKRKAAVVLEVLRNQTKGGGGVSQAWGQAIGARGVDGAVPGGW